jgi:hypothetical protein
LDADRRDFKRDASPGISASCSSTQMQVTFGIILLLSSMAAATAQYQGIHPALRICKES